MQWGSKWEEAEKWLVICQKAFIFFGAKNQDRMNETIGKINPTDASFLPDASVPLDCPAVHRSVSRWRHSIVTLIICRTDPLLFFWPTFFLLLCVSCVRARPCVCVFVFVCVCVCVGGCVCVCVDVKSSIERHCIILHQPATLIWHKLIIHPDMAIDCAAYCYSRFTLIIHVLYMSRGACLLDKLS